MLASDLRALQDSYQEIYEENDGISCELIEEVVEELIEECVEFGYTLDEAADAVEQAAMLYIDEAKVTYGSDTESPEQRRERAKAKVGAKKAEARKTAVKTAVGRVKAKAAGAAAGASIAGSIAKDTARRAARTAVHKVKYGAEKKKEQVKSGVKSMIGKGLRKAAGAVGKVASKAAGAAARLGEEYVDENRRMARDPEGRKSGRSKQPDPSKAGFTGVGNMSIDQIRKMSARIEKDKTKKEEFELWVNALVEEGYDLSGYTWDEMYEFYLDEDSRRMSNKQKTASVRQNIKAFGSNFTPPNNYDPDANRGKGEVLTRKQIEKKRRKALRQEEFESVSEMNAGPSTPVKYDSHMGQLVPNQGAGRPANVRLKQPMGLKKGGTVKACEEYTQDDVYDIVLEYLMNDGHASTTEEAHYVMTQMDAESIQSIIENVMGGPVMKPVSGLGGGKPSYPPGAKKPAPTGAKLPPV
ncbi:MAG: hypothetical protein ACO3DY_05920 [Candidatus Nanopelagicaceae bacterium]